ncbi:hypothetical protein [Thalassotalea sp. PLHSN55]|uniref:hypothetical protein n=1 Tax=Thalassotalea sp. PLHSN55 TaxID=3435888 RepID=UPI003F858BA8
MEDMSNNAQQDNQQNDQQGMEAFIGLSAVLTGFNQSIIAPQLDPVDIKSTYLSFWRENTDVNEQGLSDRILSLFSTLNSKLPALTEQQIGEHMLDDEQGQAFVLACRNLIFLWYMGAWPTVIDNGNDETQGMTDSSLLSSESYTSGLVWQVMQAHPMGDSNYRYGYWSNPPADLSDYTGNATNSES